VDECNKYYLFYKKTHFLVSNNSVFCLFTQWLCISILASSIWGLYQFGQRGVVLTFPRNLELVLVVLTLMVVSPLERNIGQILHSLSLARVGISSSVASSTSSYTSTTVYSSGLLKTVAIWIAKTLVPGVVSTMDRVLRIGLKSLRVLNLFLHGIHLLFVRSFSFLLIRISTIILTIVKLIFLVARLC
jgi:hypothetical protein